MKPLGYVVVAPYMVLSLVSGLTAVLFDAGKASGYYYFALLNCVIYGIAAGGITMLHLYDNRGQWSFTLCRGVVKYAFTLGMVLIVAVGALYIRVPNVLAAFDLLPESSSKMLGAYDPNSTFTKLDLEQIFQPWRLDDTTELRAQIDRVVSKGHRPLVTLEPWPFNYDYLLKETLWDDIWNGRYDSTIRIQCEALGEYPGEILVRFAHEMDMPGLNPWSTEDELMAVAGFVHFSRLCKESADNVRIMWSPAGTSDSIRYYPGDDVVDYIGVTVLSAQEWDEGLYGINVRSFGTLLEEKLSIFEELDKPFIVAEAGVSRRLELAQTLALIEMLQAVKDTPEVSGLIYFNAPQPVNIYSQGERPDWQLSSFQAFLIQSLWQQ